jgi:hypothetical protein
MTWEGDTVWMDCAAMNIWNCMHFRFRCKLINSSWSSYPQQRMLVYDAHPFPLQNIFYKLAYRSVFCQDTLTLTTNCSNSSITGNTTVKPSKVTFCQNVPPPPKVPVCNVTVQVGLHYLWEYSLKGRDCHHRWFQGISGQTVLITCNPSLISCSNTWTWTLPQIHRASGGLTPSLCQAFGSTINSLYGSPILFRCESAEGDSMRAAATTTNSMPVLNKLRTSIRKNHASIEKVSLKYIFRESGEVYNQYKSYQLIVTVDCSNQ